MKSTGLTLTLIASLFAGAAFADKATDRAIKARQSLMKLYEFNLIALGAMAKGSVPYDAETASAHAANMASLSTLSHAGFWLQGSDVNSGAKTNALPEIWNKYPDIDTKAKDLGDASAALSAAAGTDLASLRGAMGAVGGACVACHKAYRQEE